VAEYRVIYDAVIIGGGPSGATAALLLARAGWSVALIEKRQFPRPKVCGEFVSASSLPLLHELGIADAFLAAAGPPIRRVGFFAGPVTRAAPMPAASAGGRWGRALGRDTLDALLLNAAARAGAEIVQPFAAKSLRRDGQAFICSAAGKNATRDIAARVVIAAHGSWGPGPLRAQQATRHRGGDLLAFKARFTGARLPRDLMPLLLFPGGYGGLVHTDHGRVSLSCCIRRDVLQTLRRDGDTMNAAQAVFQHIRVSCRGADNALADATLEGRWLSAGPIRPGIRVRYAGGVFYIGNAAGEAHPIVAEGISMAMQSASLLSRRLLAAGASLEHAGQAYAADWHAAFAARVRAAALFAQAARWPRIADAAAPLIGRFPGLLTFGARLSGKTTMLAAP
jgi:flavin-dependent dehydrogenase